MLGLQARPELEKRTQVQIHEPFHRGQVEEVVQLPEELLQLGAPVSSL